MVRLLGLFFIAFFLVTTAADANRLGSHAMLYPETPYEAKEQMFAEAKEAGASMIRVDISLASIFIEGKYSDPDDNFQEWSRADQFAQLSQKYNLPLLIVIYGTPTYLSDCQGEAALRCPPNDLQRYGEMVGAVASRYRHVSGYYEILNEPDDSKYFSGTTEQYVAMLRVAKSAIGDSKLVLGGISDIENSDWVDQIIDQGAAPFIDIPAIHLRSSARGAAKLTARWRQYFTEHGVDGPLWLTEFGYPADAGSQWDAAYRSGEESQAQFYHDSLPWIVYQGAERIFITQRDWGGGAFASEGLLDTPDPLPGTITIRRRPAFYIFQNYANFLPSLPPPAAAGLITISAKQAKRVAVKRKRIDLTFSCPEAGNCPKQSFRLRLRGGGSYLVRLPLGIEGKSERRVTIRLTARTIKLLRRKSLSATLSTLQGKKLISLRLMKLG